MPRWSKIDPNATAKTCNKCKIEKALSEFSIDRDNRGGRSHSCRACVALYMADRWRSNSDHRAKQQQRARKNYESVESRAKFLVRNARVRRPDGFTLTLEHVIAGIERGICPMTGLMFDLTNAHEKATGRSRNPYAPSLDRIDSRLDYTNENCRIVCTQYNIMKGELSDSELRYICELIVRRA